MRNRWRKESKKIKRRNSLIKLSLGVLIAATAFLHLILGSDGLLTYYELKTKVSAYQSKTKRIKKENEIMMEKIKHFQDTDDSYLLEERARELGYVRPGEIIYKYDY